MLKLQREGLQLLRIQAMPEEAVAGVPGRELVMRIAVAPGVTLDLALGSGSQDARRRAVEGAGAGLRQGAGAQAPVKQSSAHRGAVAEQRAA